MSNAPKTGAKKAAKKSAAAKVALTEKEKTEAAAERIASELAELEATVTQREWLLVCNQLDRNRAQIAADGGLRLLALAWVRQKREHGGASWERLLDLTDTELLELHGFQIENPAAEAGEGEAAGGE